jgi:hypothetical protein
MEIAILFCIADESNSRDTEVFVFSTVYSASIVWIAEGIVLEFETDIIVIIGKCEAQILTRDFTSCE